MGEKTFLNQMKTEKRFALGSGAASQQKFGKCLNAAPDPDDFPPRPGSSSTAGERLDFRFRVTF